METTVTETAEMLFNQEPESLAARLAEVEIPEFTEVFVREQAAGPREFNVRGPKAAAVRALIFLDVEVTRKDIAALAGCSVSRVGEVVWGLEHDNLDFPAIPKRYAKVVQEDAAEEA